LRVPVERARVEPLRPLDDVLRPDVLRLRVPVEREPLRDELLLREPERPDAERERPDVDPPVLRARDEAERARLVPTVCRPPEPLPLADAPPSLSSSSDSDDSSSSSSPSPSSFFATPTAAGTATPRAAPATTFCVVDMPSSSFSPFSL
jgi:hypothetical protein